MTRGRCGCRRPPDIRLPLLSSRWSLPLSLSSLRSLSLLSLCSRWSPSLPLYPDGPYRCHCSLDGRCDGSHSSQATPPPPRGVTLSVTPSADARSRRSGRQRHLHRYEAMTHSLPASPYLQHLRRCPAPLSGSQPNIRGTTFPAVSTYALSERWMMMLSLARVQALWPALARRLSLLSALELDMGYLWLKGSLSKIQYTICAKEL